MSAATDKTNLAELRRTMTLWHNRVTALGFDGVSDVIALAEAGGDQMKKAWPIGERIALRLMMIKQIGEGSTTANSLPHVARIADEALECIRQRPAAQATPEPSRGRIGTGAHALANELAQAVAQDDADPDGHDMSAGLFGPNVSAWLRKISADYLPQHAMPEPVGNKRECPHCNYTGSAHCGDVDDKLKANGGDPKDCSNAKVYGLRAATPESVGEPRCSTCGVTMDEPHHPACGAVTAAIIGLSTMAAQDKEARRRELAEKIRETLRGVFTRPAPGVPEGFVLVPVEPTWEMRIAASTAYREARDGHYTARMEQAADCWRIMLAAAQAKGADHDH